MDTVTSPLLRSSPETGPECPPATAAQLGTITALAVSRGATRLAMGSGRTINDLASVRAFTARWEALGGEVILTLTWPETAASWLRQATRFAAADPDLWIMTGSTVGWAQMTRRLLWSTSWRPERTILTAPLADRDALDLVGLFNLDGITAVSASGQAWQVTGEAITSPHRDVGRRSG